MHSVDVNRGLVLNIPDGQKLDALLNIKGDSVINILAGKGTRVKIYERQKTKANINIDFVLAKDARVEYVSLSDADRTAKTTVALNGDRSEFICTKFMLAGAKDQIVARHQARDTKSVIRVKGAVKAAHVDMVGKVQIAKEAKGSDAFFSARFITSEGAIAVAQPELEILNKEVKAGHEVAITPISEEKIFYLMSRGMARKDAEQLILSSFIMLPEELR